MRDGRQRGAQAQDWLETEADLNLLSEQARQLAGKAPPERGQLHQAEGPPRRTTDAREVLGPIRRHHAGCVSVANSNILVPEQSA